MGAGRRTSGPARGATRPGADRGSHTAVDERGTARARRRRPRETVTFDTLSPMRAVNVQQHTLRAGMVGMGMIFDDTYRPAFEALHADGLYRRDFGYVDVALTAVATRTGTRAAAYKRNAGGRIADFVSFEGPDSIERAVSSGADFVCVATPDNR